MMAEQPKHVGYVDTFELFLTTKIENTFSQASDTQGISAYYFHPPGGIETEFRKFKAFISRKKDGQHPDKQPHAAHRSVVILTS
jgi:hypothetical protein